MKTKNKTMTLFLFFSIFFYQISGQAGTGGLRIEPMTVEEARSLIANPPDEIKKILKTVPEEYSFYIFEADPRPKHSKFPEEEGLAVSNSSVDYTDQTRLQVFINDLKLNFGRYNRGHFNGDPERALKAYRGYYDFDPDIHENRSFYVKARSESGGSFPIYEGLAYGDLCSGRTDCKINLRQKTAGVDKKTPLQYRKLLGWNSPEIDGVVIDKDFSGSISTDGFMQAMFKVLVKNSSSPDKSFSVANGDLEPQVIRKASVTPQGLDIAQLAQKLMHSAVSFYQAAVNCFGVSNPSGGMGLYSDNNDLKNLFNPYTALQHSWDEAFGWFGASRNYLEYSDLQIRKGFSIDSYVSADFYDENDDEFIILVRHSHKTLTEDGWGDLVISLGSEKNFGLSLNAAKRDLGASLGNQNFTEEIMSAMLSGRHLIQEKPENYLKYAQAFSVIALSQWEKVIAATVIHYINKTMEDYERYGSEKYKFTELAKHFSEMKGFSFAFQFNPHSQMSDEDFIEMHKLMGDQPADPSGQSVGDYRLHLEKARSLIQKSFGFETVNVENW